MFHTGCLNQWAATSVSGDVFCCPLCRHRMGSPIPASLRGRSPSFDLSDVEPDGVPRSILDALAPVAMSWNPLASTAALAPAPAPLGSPPLFGAPLSPLPPLSPAAPPNGPSPVLGVAPRAGSPVPEGPALLVPARSPSGASSSFAAAASAPSPAPEPWRRRSQRVNAGVPAATPFWVAPSSLGTSSSRRSDDGSLASSSAPGGRFRSRSTSPRARRAPPAAPPSPPGSRPLVVWGSGVPRPAVAWGSGVSGPLSRSSPPPPSERGGPGRW